MATDSHYLADLYGALRCEPSAWLAGVSVSEEFKQTANAVLMRNREAFRILAEM